MKKVFVRIFAPIAVLILAIISLKSGVVLPDKDLSKLPISMLIFHCIGLFTFGAKDFGEPGGNFFWSKVLYFTYFIAPLISISAVAECLYFLSKPALSLLLFRGNHFIIIGNGRIGKAAAEQLQNRFKTKYRIVIIDKNIEVESTSYDVFKTNKIYINGDITNNEILEKINFKKARGLFILTDDEWINLKTFYLMSDDVKESLHKRIYTRVSSLPLKYFLEDKNLNVDWRINHKFINVHTLAIQQLFSNHKAKKMLYDEKEKLINWTKNKDKQFIFFGFGRYAQSLFYEMFNRGLIKSDNLVILDSNAESAWKNYSASYKFANMITPKIINGSISSFSEQHFCLSNIVQEDAIVFFCLSDETINIKTASVFHKMFDDSHSKQYVLRVQEEKSFPPHLLQAVVGKNYLLIPTYDWMEDFYEEEFSNWG